MARELPGSRRRPASKVPAAVPADGVPAGPGGSASLDAGRLAARSCRGPVGVEHAIEPGLLHDYILTGSVLACVPHRALFTSTRGLFSVYKAGSVKHVILLAEVVQDSPGWRFYAQWPHCIVTYMAPDGSPEDWSGAFCSSDDRDVQERVRDHFEPLGFYYPNAASADTRGRDGARES